MNWHSLLAELVERLVPDTRRDRDACLAQLLDRVPKQHDAQVPPRLYQFYLAAKFGAGKHSHRVYFAFAFQLNYSQVAASNSTGSPQITRVAGGQGQPVVYRS